METDDLINMVWEHIDRYMDIAIAQYGEGLRTPEVRFDLTGASAAGKASRDGRYVRYHMGFLAKYKREYCEKTVPHEIAHSIVGQLWPGAQPHGSEWKGVMRVLGAAPDRCSNFSCIGIADMGKGRQRRWVYACECKEHAVTTVRHNKMRRGAGMYKCNSCKGIIHFTGRQA